MLTAISRDAEFAAAFRERVVGPKAAVGRLIFERARDRGELREGLDLDLLAPALAGICLHRLFLMGLPPDQDIDPQGGRPDHPARRARTRAGLLDPARELGTHMSDELKIDDGAARDDAVATPPKGHQRLGLALVLISIAQLMVVLDATIANIALPFIGKDLDISGTNLTWIVTGYSLVFGGLLLLGGRLADLYGRRRIFMIGLVVFAVASLLGGLAQSELLLLSARGLQGFGAALASPAALALITTTFPAGPARNRAFAIYAAMSGAGAAVGLILGGWLTGTDFSLFGTDVHGWRMTFLINVPIGIVTAFLAPRFLPESETHPGQLDIPGAITGTAGLLAIVYGLTHAGNPNYGWGDAVDHHHPGRRSRCCSRSSSPSSPGWSTRCCRSGSSPTRPEPRASWRWRCCRPRCSRCSSSSACSSRT